jgi:hypothetical protein
LLPGDPVPHFIAQTSARPDYHFGSAAGRYLALAFVPSSRSEAGQALLAAVAATRARFDDDTVAFFGVTADPDDQVPDDQGKPRVTNELPGVRWFYDADLAIARLYGALDEVDAMVPQWFLIDPALHLLATGPLAALDRLMAAVGKLGPPAQHAGSPLSAPVLIAPRIFEPDFCRHLIALYQSHGGAESGFMVEKGGKTVLAHDPSHKRRAEFLVEDENIRNACRARIQRRLLPDIEKAFQFRATEMERCLVSCYQASTGGYFNAHRDDTTKGTAHRKFAITINLNAEEYEGGELMFPEFGDRTYKPATGAAIVFSCSLLHRALPVTRGDRFAFLPFLYDEAGARVRQENFHFLEGPAKSSGGTPA